jgi:DeoR/GlpR family transcriptional regulator of sugar metabolism
MHYQVRRQKIYDLLLAKGAVSTRDLTEEFGVAHDTVHRDYTKLSKKHPIEIVRGGAILRNNLSIQAGLQTYLDETKSAPIVPNDIIKFIQDGQAIILDGGRNTVLIAQQFPLDLHATIVTNSPQIATTLAGYPSIEVIVIGGRLKSNSLIPIRTDAYEYLQMVHADLCIMSECSIDSKKGLSVSSVEEAEIKRTMISSASELAIIVTSKNINYIEHFSIGPITKVKYLIPDETVSDEFLRPFITQGLHILGREIIQQK